MWAALFYLFYPIPRVTQWVSVANKSRTRFCHFPCDNPVSKQGRYVSNLSKKFGYGFIKYTLLFTFKKFRSFELKAQKRCLPINGLEEYTRDHCGLK